MGGLASINEALIGGNLVLISPEEGVNILELLNDALGCLSNWFADIKPWSPDSVSKERHVRIKFFGVPLHGWYEDLCKVLASLVGKFLYLDVSTRRRLRFDVGRFLVVTSSPEFINKVVNVKINNVVYSMRLLEDLVGDQDPRLFEFSEVRSHIGCDFKVEGSEIVREMLMSEETRFKIGIQREDVDFENSNNSQ